MEITWDELTRVEAQIHGARGYADAYRRLLYHSARRVLEANGFVDLEESGEFPIDRASVEAQAEKFRYESASDPKGRRSTASNYADNWVRFAGWVRRYLRREAQGRAEDYLAELRRGSRTSKRSTGLSGSMRLSGAARRGESFSSQRMEPNFELEDRSLADAPQMMMMTPPREQMRSQIRSQINETHRGAVKTSFGLFEMELPYDLSPEDAVRITAAIL
ncbi:MAG: hypothetical protein F2634_09385, partial [Actinobacteria bacterium]|nr:hypothetical protein [Actinomycetota bacterium]